MRNPSANAACMTTSARPGTIIDTRLGPLSSAQRSAVVKTIRIGVRCDRQWADMALGKDVGIAGGATRTLEPNRVRSAAAEQKAVVHVSSEPEQRLVNLCHPFPGLGPGRNRRRVILGIGKVLRDSLRRCGHAVERLARIEAVF